MVDGRRRMNTYTYITPTVTSPDPRMQKAIDGWLGLYEACYVIHAEMQGGMAAEEKGKYSMNSSQPEPHGLYTALKKGAEALNEWNGFWVLGGGLAMNFHGQKRATDDVDFFLLADREKLQEPLAALDRHDIKLHAEEGASFMPPDAHWWWVPLQYGSPDATPVNVDLLVASHEFMAFLHATGIESKIQDTRVRVLSAEALLVLKLQAFRGKDQSDIEAILKSKTALDRDLLNAWVAKYKLEERLREIETRVKENPGRRG